MDGLMDALAQRPQLEQAPRIARSAAYVNHGRWLVDCPRPHCGDAEWSIDPGTGEPQAGARCHNCQLVFEIQWPPDPLAIHKALEGRPVPQTRNWAPAGHRQTFAMGFPTGETTADRHPDGQTADDLLAENHEFGGVS